MDEFWYQRKNMLNANSLLPLNADSYIGFTNNGNGQARGHIFLLTIHEEKTGTSLKAVLKIHENDHRRS